ncbi:MAG: type IV secretion system protein [Pseudomonadota bacterium]
MKFYSITCTALAMGLASLACPVRAQVLVHDPGAVAQLISQAQTAIAQLEQLREQVGQAERLYESFNDLSQVNTIAQNLLTPELRKLVPELSQYQAAAKGDLAALGHLAARAQAIRRESQLYAPDDPAAAELLEASGARAARDMALGEKIGEISDERLEGLEDLRAALDVADNARAVMDITARLAAEQAILQNDQVRLQGLLIMRDAEERLQAQREREAAAATIAARLEMFRRGAQP